VAEAISARRTTIDASHRRWAVRLWGRVATRGGAPLDTSDRIGTPENIEFSYFGAGPFVRFLAFSVDTLVWLFGFFALWLLVAILFGFASTYLIRIGLGELVDSLSEMASGLFLLSLFAVALPDLLDDVGAVRVVLQRTDARQVPVPTASDCAS